MYNLLTKSPEPSSRGGFQACGDTFPCNLHDVTAKLQTGRYTYSLVEQPGWVPDFVQDQMTLKGPIRSIYHIAWAYNRIWYMAQISRFIWSSRKQ